MRDIDIFVMTTLTEFCAAALGANAGSRAAWDRSARPAGCERTIHLTVQFALLAHDAAHDVLEIAASASTMSLPDVLPQTMLDKLLDHIV